MQSLFQRNFKRGNLSENGKSQSSPSNEIHCSTSKKKIIVNELISLEAVRTPNGPSHGKVHYLVFFPFPPFFFFELGKNFRARLLFLMASLD